MQFMQCVYLVYNICPDIHMVQSLETRVVRKPSVKADLTIYSYILGVPGYV